jgi:hypothetical protein
MNLFENLQLLNENKNNNDDDMMNNLYELIQWCKNNVDVKNVKTDKPNKYYVNVKNLKELKKLAKHVIDNGFEPYEGGSPNTQYYKGVALPQTPYGLLFYKKSYGKKTVYVNCWANPNCAALIYCE